MKSSEKQKLSLTPSILGTSGFQTLKYLLPSALSTATEYETAGYLTSGAWRLCWRSSTSDASTEPRTGQKSDWNALPPPPSWSSHCVCHVLLISVTYTCNCLSRIIFTYRKHWTAHLNQYKSSHSSSVASLTFPQIHTYSDRDLLVDSHPYRSVTNGPPHTQKFHPPPNPNTVKISVARNALAPRESPVSTDKPHLAFAHSDRKKRLTRLKISINCTVITLIHLFLLITCVGASHNFHPAKIAHHDQVLSNVYHVPHPDSNPSIVDIPGLDQVLVDEDMTNSKPSRAELIERTPSYMFDMHDRHKRDWWDFDQFSDGHLRHPLHSQNIHEHDNRKLGTVTAIRHHKHIETEEHGSKWARTRRSTNPFSPLESEHNLFFKLADMPGNEHLLAASIRLRYVPTEDWNRTTVNTQCRDTAHHEKWPVTVWLHYNSPVKSDTYETKTIGSFEPDTEYCGQTSDESNGKLIHFPAGWFNIPLNEVILAMIREVSSRNNGSNGDRTNNDGRVISMRVRSLVSDLHFPTHTEQVLRLKKPDNTGEKQYLDTQWLHEAPHLFTFHRDPALVEHVRRTRRSVPLSLETPVESSTIKSTTESLRTKVQDGGTFMKRYKKLQQLLQSKLQNTDRKRRPRRRAYYQRRQSRSSHDQWRSSANTYQYRQHSSANGYRDQRAYNSKRYTKEESRGTGMSKTAEQYGYDSSDALSVDMNSPNYLDSLCQRRELIIDFAAVGWAGWVIAPTSYNARYCQGQCPFPLSTHYNTTNHAVLLQLVHLLDAARIPGPCCVPNQLSPQSLLYHTQSGDVVLRVYQDMVVESCACR